MKKLIFCLVIISIFACSKADDKKKTFLDCNDNSINYKIYTGENIDCQFYFTLTEFKNQNFIELNSHCADLTRPVVLNEMCQDICADDPYNINSPCGKYLSGREIIEIYLIEK